MRGTGFEIFSVDDSGAQLMWSAWPAPEVTVEVAGRRLVAAAGPPAWLRRRGRRPVRLSGLPGGPGTLRVGGLRPGVTYPVHVRHDGGHRQVAGRITTLSPPPGRPLARFATISDLHIGERAFGALGTIEERVPLPAGCDPYPLRCARAAIEQAVTWGAQLLVVKGDLTRDSEPAEFREAGRLLASAGIPVLVTLGNHDVRHGIDGAAILTDCGVRTSVEPQHRDLPGIRIVTGHSARPRRKRGYVAERERSALAALAADSPLPTGLILHHPPQRRPWPTHYPPGLVAHDARLLLGALTRANPRSVVLTGHTHRNRTYRQGGVTVAEVGATKDFPGQWAGYQVYEGGIMQAVYRTACPDVLAWTETTRHALGGIWGLWSAGRLSDRCWSEAWPAG